MSSRTGKPGFIYRGISVALNSDGRLHGKVPVGTKPNGEPDRRHVAGSNDDLGKDQIKADIDKHLDAVATKTVQKAGKAPTVRAWFTHWLTHIAPFGENALRQNTIDNHWSACRAWIFPHLGQLRLDELDTDALDAMYAAMRKAGRASTTVLRMHAVVHRGLEVALHRHKIVRNVADSMDNPGSTKVRKRRRALSKVQSQKVLDVINARPDRLRWRLGLGIGPRQGEALGLRWECVDLTAGTIVLDWQLQRLTYRHGCEDAVACARKHCRTESTCVPRYRHGCGNAATCPGRGRVKVEGGAKPAYCPQRVIAAPCLRHKRPCPPLCVEGCTDHADRCTKPLGGLVITRAKTVKLDDAELDDDDDEYEDDEDDEVQHIVSIPPTLVGELMAHKKAQAALQLSMGKNWKKNDLVFCLVDGSPIDPKRDLIEWRKILHAAGVRPGGTHVIRRTAATRLLEEGEDIAVVQEVLGHTDIRTTRGYTKVTIGLTKRAADTMDSALFGAPVTDIVTKRRERGSS